MSKARRKLEGWRAAVYLRNQTWPTAAQRRRLRRKNGVWPLTIHNPGRKR